MQGHLRTTIKKKNIILAHFKFNCQLVMVQYNKYIYTFITLLVLQFPFYWHYALYTCKDIMKNLSVMLRTAVSAFCDTTTYLFTLYRKGKKGLGCMQFSQKLRLLTLSVFVLVHISTTMNKAILLYHLNNNYSTSAKYPP